MTKHPGRKTILVVDDDEHLRLLTLTVLRHAGYSVVAEANGLQALTRLSTIEVDLMVVDIDLDDEMDGVEFLEQIKANPATANVPVMILSGHSQFSEIDRGLQAGAVQYMTKPYEVSQIIRNVRNILASHES